ncbi:centrosomal protein of 68 kDa [Anolis sagrei]|uniref:centrosomal protein of 68 kDa n=1 Tax=Anolis sagrei TaxID=38937 RepID=UPI0035207506
MTTVKHSEASLLDLPGILPPRSVASARYNSATRAFHSFDGNQMWFTTNSSTPKHLLGKENPNFNDATPLLSGTNISSQPPEVSDFGLEKMIRSKRFSAAGALLLPEMPTSSNLHPLSDHEGSPRLSTCRQSPMVTCSLMGQVRKMSSFQADYWACAIPDSLPPSPDRQSPHWNPNKEYEDLLDYTYPLRPKYKLAQNIQDSAVHDSGVDLDSFSISPESTLKSVSMHDQKPPVLGTQSTQRLFTPFLKKLEGSDPVSHYNISPIGKVSFGDAERSISYENVDGLSPSCYEHAPSSSANRDENVWNARGDDNLNRMTTIHSSFIRSTRVLPLRKECSGDDEYLSLPPRLKELETLALQLTDLSLTIRRPEYDSAHDGFPGISGNGKQLLSEVQADGGSNDSQCEFYCDSPGSLHKHGEEDFLSHQPENVPRKAASSDPIEIGRLEFQNSGSNQGKEVKNGSSLTDHIKMFCGQLEELICWLHKVADVTDNWIPPKPDVKSVKAALQNYLEFKKDLAEHQALTEGVLQDGERLLQCMASSSPENYCEWGQPLREAYSHLSNLHVAASYSCSEVLQDTLRLIGKQTDELESHAERLYESVLSVVDTLGAGVMENCDTQPIGAQS